VKLYNSCQATLEEGGSAALADTAAGGKDLIISMSEFTLEHEPDEKFKSFIFQFWPTGMQMRRTKCLKMLFLPT
jgi:hypothetical protein